MIRRALPSLVLLPRGQGFLGGTLSLLCAAPFIFIRSMTASNSGGSWIGAGGKIQNNTAQFGEPS